MGSDEEVLDGRLGGANVVCGRCSIAVKDCVPSGFRVLDEIVSIHANCLGPSRLSLNRK